MKTKVDKFVNFWSSLELDWSSLELDQSVEKSSKEDD